MKVLFDNQVFAMQRFGGISRYFYELLTHSHGLFECLLPYSYSDNIYEKKLCSSGDFLSTHNFRGKNRITRAIYHHNLIKSISSSEIDIVHPTYYDVWYANRVEGKKIIITCHDMIHELFPQYYARDKHTVLSKKRALFLSDKIIAISECTKRDIMKVYPQLDSNKIHVVYHGPSFECHANDYSKKNYVLFTGLRGGYKNFFDFIKAVSPLLIKYNLHLVCSGNDFSPEERGLFLYYGIEKLVSHVFATEEELPRLYGEALAFVFPSMYEGFGIPILEAFAAGCPVVSSDTSSLPEIAQDGALYFDPHNVDDMRRKIERVITSIPLQKDLVEKGFMRLKDFSWQKCAAETSSIYKAATGEQDKTRQDKTRQDKTRQDKTRQV